MACLKLSRLSTDWHVLTWLCFLAAFSGFWLTFEFLVHLKGGERGKRSGWYSFAGYERPLFLAMIWITILSVLAFSVEAAVLGFIPFFVKGVPHAYSAFHITGVHYLTVSCVLVPALSVLYLSIERGRNARRFFLMAGMDFIACLIPVLCVSRFQLILAVGLAVFTYIAMEHRIRVFTGFGLGFGMVLIYIILTVARGHDVAYLNGIFEMKNSRMPIFVTQPYMYIANNYDNFNCMVEGLPSHTLGLRILFPLWAFSGLKFLVPALVDFPLYVTKEELTTVTLFYDSFYDFGLLGVLGFGGVLGGAAFWIGKGQRYLHNPVGYLFYAQFALYMVFSFFTTWFSNPATWFYFGVTGVVFVWCGGKRQSKKGWLGFGGNTFFRSLIDPAGGIFANPGGVLACQGERKKKRFSQSLHCGLKAFLFLFL